MAVARMGMSALVALALGSCASNEPATTGLTRAAAPSLGPAEPERAPLVQSPAEPAESLDEAVAIMHARMRQCWRTPPIVDGFEPVIVRVRFRLDAQGRLEGRPVVLEPSSAGPGASAATVLAEQNAVVAVLDCEPYDFFPPDRYEDWKEMVLTFAPEP
jgi:colicin import membrane protein